MNPRTIAMLAAFLVAAPALATDGRIRIENTGGSGRVEIVMSDETVRTVEIKVSGGASGEMMVVEAPAPMVRLSGGSIDIDMLLEARVQQRLGQTSPQRATVSILPSSQPVRVESQRNLNDVFTNVGFALESAWYAPVPVRSDVRSRGRQEAHVCRPSSRGSFSVRPRGGSLSMRAVMPRR